ASNLFKILAGGELVIDKLPFMPNRIEPASLTARCLSGALAGASIYKSVDRNVAVGALVGTSAAVISSFASFYLRKVIRNKANVPDAAIAVVEDSLVLTMGWRLTR
ncbi:MAG: hypothetical protein M3N14_13235, partial [Bacteroidota bacterium]|nr:hypothetical protein [Bacteroidota bacterium]